MATATRIPLSGSTTGRGILVAATSTPGTTVHTAGANTGTTGGDVLWCWCANSSGSPIKLTLEWGGVTVPNDLIEKTIPAEDGAYLVVPGLFIQNSLVVRAFAGTTNLLVIYGYCNRLGN